MKDLRSRCKTKEREEKKKIFFFPSFLQEWWQRVEVAGKLSIRGSGTDLTLDLIIFTQLYFYKKRKWNQSTEKLY